MTCKQVWNTCDHQSTKGGGSIEAKDKGSSKFLVMEQEIQDRNVAILLTRYLHLNEETFAVSWMVWQRLWNHVFMPETLRSSWAASLLPHNTPLWLKVYVQGTTIVTLDGRWATAHTGRSEQATISWSGRSNFFKQWSDFRTRLLHHASHDWVSPQRQVAQFVFDMRSHIWNSRTSVQVLGSASTTHEVLVTVTNFAWNTHQSLCLSSNRLRRRSQQYAPVRLRHRQLHCHVTIVPNIHKQ